MNAPEKKRKYPAYRLALCLFGLLLALGVLLLVLALRTGWKAPGPDLPGLIQS